MSLENSAFVKEVHNFEQDPQSGAGNCKHCGWPKNALLHPHPFTQQAYILGRRCVCQLTEMALIHQITSV